MRRRGWSAPRLAEVAGGVSPSSIRAYLADRTAPRPAQALAIALALGPSDGKALLESWGHTDLASGFDRETHPARTESAVRVSGAHHRRHNRLEYSGEPLSGAGTDVAHALIRWIQHIEAPTGLPTPGTRVAITPPKPTAGP